MQAGICLTFHSASSNLICIKSTACMQSRQPSLASSLQALCWQSLSLPSRTALNSDCLVLLSSTQKLCNLIFCVIPFLCLMHVKGLDPCTTHKRNIVLAAADSPIALLLPAGSGEVMARQHQRQRTAAQATKSCARFSLTNSQRHSERG